MAISTEQSTSKSKLGPIVFACDGRYAMPLSVTMRSLVDSNPDSWPISFHVLFVDVSEQTKMSVLNSLPQGAATIEWVLVDLEKFSSFSTQSHISKITYARILISRLLPGIAGRILYLDADILVLSRLNPLWDEDLQGAVIGAVLDDGILSMVERKDPRWDAIPKVEAYFNAGVLLIDLDRWRTSQIAERSMDYLERNPKTPLSDQDALNVACNGQWQKIDRRWNYQIYQHCSAVKQLVRDKQVTVAHFVMSKKPWFYQELNVNASLYDSYRDKTFYSRTSSERILNWLQTAWAKLKRTTRTLLPASPTKPD